MGFGVFALDSTLRSHFPLGLTLLLTIQRASHTIHFYFSPGQMTSAHCQPYIASSAMPTSTSATMSKPCRFYHICQGSLDFRERSWKITQMSKLASNLPWQYHKHDLTLARTMGDRLGEAKASGNLGNTLKVVKHFQSTEYLLLYIRLWGSLRRPLFAVGDI